MTSPSRDSQLIRHDLRDCYDSVLKLYCSCCCSCCCCYFSMAKIANKTVIVHIQRIAMGFPLVFAANNVRLCRYCFSVFNFFGCGYLCFGEKKRQELCVHVRNQCFKRYFRDSYQLTGAPGPGVNFPLFQPAIGRLFADLGVVRYPNTHAMSYRSVTEYS